MSLKKTYLDSGVLITAFRGVHSTSIKANSLLNSSDRAFVSSQFVKLEILPKARHHQQQDEIEFYETFFDAVSDWAAVVNPAHRESCVPKTVAAKHHSPGASDETLKRF